MPRLGRERPIAVDTKSSREEDPGSCPSWTDLPVSRRLYILSARSQVDLGRPERSPRLWRLSEDHPDPRNVLAPSASQLRTSRAGVDACFPPWPDRERRQMLSAL